MVTIPSNLAPKNYTGGAITEAQRQDVQQYGSLQAAQEAKYQQQAEAYNQQANDQQKILSDREKELQKIIASSYAAYEQASYSKIQRRKIQAERNAAKAELAQLQGIKQSLQPGTVYSNIDNVITDVKSYGQRVKSYEYDRAMYSNGSKKLPEGSFYSSDNKYIFNKDGYIIAAPRGTQLDSRGYPIDPKINQSQSSLSIVAPPTSSPSSQYSSSAVQGTPYVQDNLLGIHKQNLYYELGADGKPVSNTVYASPYKKQILQVQSSGITQLGQSQSQYAPGQPIRQNIDTLKITPGPQPLRLPEKVPSVGGIGTDNYNSVLGLYSRPSDMSGKQTPYIRQPTTQEQKQIDKNSDFKTFGSSLAAYKREVVDPLAYEGKIPIVTKATGYNLTPLSTVWSWENAANVAKLYQQEVVEPISKSGVFNLYQDKVVIPLSESKVFRGYENNVVIPSREAVIKGVEEYKQGVVQPLAGFVQSKRNPLTDISKAKQYIDRLAQQNPEATVQLNVGGKMRNVSVSEFSNMGLIEFMQKVYGKQVQESWKQAALDLGSSEQTASYVRTGAKITSDVAPYLLPGYFEVTTGAKIAEAEIGGGVFGGPKSAVGYAKQNPLETAFLATSLYIKGVTALRKQITLTQAEKIEKYKEFLTEEVSSAKGTPEDLSKKTVQEIPNYKSIDKIYFNEQTGKVDKIVGIKGKGYTTITTYKPTGERFGEFTETYMKKGLFNQQKVTETAKGFIDIKSDGTVIKTLKYPTGEMKVVTVSNGKQTTELFSKSGKELVSITQDIDPALQESLKLVKKKTEKIIFDPQNQGDRYLITKSKVTLSGKRVEEVVKIKDMVTGNEVVLSSNDPLARKVLSIQGEIPESIVNKLYGKSNTVVKAYRTKSNTAFEVRAEYQSLSDSIYSGERKGTLGFKRVVYGGDKPTTIEISSKIRGTPKIVYGVDTSKDIGRTAYGTKGYSRMQVVQPKMSREITQLTGGQSSIAYVNPKSPEYSSLAKQFAREQKVLSKSAKSMAKETESLRFNYVKQQLTSLGFEQQSIGAARRQKIKQLFRKFKKPEPVQVDYGISYPAYVNGGSGGGLSTSFYQQGSIYGPTSASMYGPASISTSEIITTPLTVVSPTSFVRTGIVNMPRLSTEQVATSASKLIQQGPATINFLAPALLFMNQQKEVLQEKQIIRQDIKQEMILKENTIFQQPMREIVRVQQDVKQINKQISKQIQQPIANQAQEAANTSTIGEATSVYERPQQPKEPTKIVKLTLPGEEDDSKLKSQVAYQGFALQKGKYVKVTNSPMTREGALDVVARVVDNTTSGQGKIEPIKEKRRQGSIIMEVIKKFSPKEVKRGDDYFKRTESKFREFKLYAGQKIPVKDIIIEKKGSRSDTQGEKRGLVFGQFSARSYKKSVGLPVRRNKGRRTPFGF